MKYVLADEKFRGSQFVLDLFNVRFAVGEVFAEDIQKALTFL